MSALKTIDEKGRLTVGREFAGRTVQVEKTDDGWLLIKFVRVVPDREAWLWENPTALALVERGLQQARDGEFGEDPDLAAMHAFADSIPGDK